MIGLKRLLRGRDDHSTAAPLRDPSAAAAQAEALIAEAATLADAGDLDAALERCRRAQQSAPEVAHNRSRTHYERGLVQHEQHKFEQAIASFRIAIALRPNDADAHFCLGNAQHETGLRQEALDNYRRAITLRPQFTAAYVNAGVVLESQERFDDAADSYERAIELEPHNPIPHGNLAYALYRSGDYDEALQSFVQALELNPTPEIRTAFVACLNRASLLDTDERFRRLLAQALVDGWGWKSALTKAATRVIKSDKAVAECIRRAVDAWPRRLSAPELFEAHTRVALTGDPLIKTLLETAPVDDLPFERCLTMVRRIVLDEAMNGGAGDSRADDLAFCAALARQCFVNEYVFSCTADETGATMALRDSIASRIAAGETIPPMSLVAVAAYVPLLSIDGAASLLQRDYPVPVAALLRQQVAEPLEERRDRTSIRQLTPINDGVSAAVRQQYEENPYPRWTSIPVPPKQLAVDDHLAELFPFGSFVPLGKTVDVDILVAGCGTGGESIDPAMLFSGANVLAVDLSLASLAYAKRKTRERRLKNIDYAQADITQLGSIKRRFDVILSSGVLHHLENPAAGLAVLVSLLRPGGVMRLALYSELGRRSVVAARRLIAERGYTSSPEDIRRCREALTEAGGEFDILVASSDFYTTSECRDLLFHVQEHRFTLPQVKAMLVEAGLNFIGMIVNEAMADNYAARFPEDKAMSDLDRWHRLETEIPDMFVAMYRFWVQKPPAP